MAFYARDQQSLSKQHRRQHQQEHKPMLLRRSWSKEVERSSSVDFSASHSGDSDDDDDDDDVISSIEGGPPSINGPNKHPKKSSKQKGLVAEDTPTTVELSDFGASGSDNSAFDARQRIYKKSSSRTPRSGIQAGHPDVGNMAPPGPLGHPRSKSTKSRERDDSTSRMEKIKAKAMKSSQSQSGNPKEASHRDRGVKRSKSADTNLLEHEAFDYDQLAATLGLPVALFKQGANAVMQGKVGTKGRRSSTESADDKTSQREFIANTDEKVSRTARRRSSVVASYQASSGEPPSMEAEQAEKAAKVADQQKAMNRLERMKAKAIKAATKELGVDEKNLAEVMGLTNVSGSRGNQQVQEQKAATRDPKGNPSSGQNEAAEIFYLAETLGLPVAMFGFDSKGTQPTTAAAGKNEKLPYRSPEKDPVDMIQAREVEHFPSSVVPERQPSSDTHQSKVLTFKPQPKTVDEKRSEKKKALTRLERIKAKAIKSAHKELGVDPSSLAQIMGMKSEVDGGPTVRSKHQREGELSPDEAAQMEYLADTLGLPPSFFGIQKNLQSQITGINDNKSSSASISSSGSKKLFHEAIKNVKIGDPISESDSDDDVGNGAEPSLELPQQGSLAAALGMAIQPSSRSPPIRQAMDMNDTNSTSHHPSGVSPTVNKRDEADGPKFQPQPGSLAAALGMAIDPSSRAPPVRQAVDARQDDAQGDGDQISRFQAQPGSLAAALGMAIDPSSRAPPMRQVPKAHDSIATPMMFNKLSSLQTIGDGHNINERYAADGPKFQPQPGSLAAALGMAIDPSSRAPPVRQAVDARQDDAQGDGDHISRFQAQPGSLAAALGMAIDPSSRAPPVRQVPVAHDSIATPMRFNNLSLKETIGVGHNTLARYAADGPKFQPQPGSLAAALGMAIDPSSRAPPVRQVVDARQDDAQGDGEHISRFQAQPGSLAAALGMAIDPSSRAPPPVRQRAVVDDFTTKVRTVDSKKHVFQEWSENRSEYALIEKRTNVELMIAQEAFDISEALGLKAGWPKSAGVSQDAVQECSQQIAPLTYNGSVEEAFGIEHRIVLKQKNGGASFQHSAGAVRLTYSCETTRNPNPGSLAAALGMQVDAKPVRQEGLASSATKTLVDAIVSRTGQSRSNTSMKGCTVARSQAQPGSLAAALGINVDSSSRAPPIRVAREGGRTPKKNIVDAMLSNVSKSPNRQSPISAVSPSQPLSGSLAAALGMQVDASRHAPPVRLETTASLPTKTLLDAVVSKSAGKFMSNETVEKHAKSHFHTQAQPGSLAAALGMNIDSSARAPPIRVVHESRSKPKKSIFDIMLSRVSQSPSQQNTNSQGLTSTPQPGSLAAALGMQIDSRRHALPVRYEETPSHPAKTQVDSTLQYRNLAESPSQPEPGSLADALGMQVDAGNHPPSMRQDVSPSRPTQTLATYDAPLEGYNAGCIQAQPGSLAAALGINVDSSSPAPPIHVAREASITPKKNIFDAMLSNVSNSQTIQSQQHEVSPSQPNPGSLAAALGMQVDARRHAPPVRHTTTTNFPTKTLFDAVVSKPSGKLISNTTVQADDHSQGMNVDYSSRAPAIRFVSEESIMPKNNFFDAILCNVSQSPNRQNPNYQGMAIQPQPGSLAAALGIQIDSSRHAPPVRYEGTPSRTAKTLFEAVVSKSAGNLIPTDINKQVNTQAQPGSLAAALGINVDSSSRAPAIRVSREASITPKKNIFDAMVSKVSNSPTRQNQSHAVSASQPQPGSLAAALGMQVDASRHAAPVRQEATSRAPKKLFDTVVSKSACKFVSHHANTSAHLHEQAQPGSLAAALGMNVDSSARAPPIRVEGEASSTPKRTIFDAMLSNTSKSPTVQSQNHEASLSQPQPGSLAAALGMQVDASRHAAPVRQEGTPNRPTKTLFETILSNSAGKCISSETVEKHAHVHVHMEAQPGSLAAALGMNVECSSRAPPIRVEREARGTPKKSLFDVMLSNVSKSPSVEHQNNAESPSQPQPGSLAAALGLQVDASRHTPPDRQQRTPSRPTKTLFDTVVSKSASKFVSNETISKHAHLHAQPGSLAAALGMNVDSSTRAPPIRIERGASSAPKKSLFDVMLSNVSKSPSFENQNHAESPSHPQPGSLAAALGMQVDGRRHAPPVRQGRTPSRPTKTLFDAVVSKSAGKFTSNETVERHANLHLHSHAQPGSLAAALGMHVDSSSRAPPIPVERESRPTPKKSLLDVVLSSASKSPSFENRNHADSPSQPQPGSLAAALGMQVDASRRAPPVRQEITPSRPAKTLFDAVVSKSAGKVISTETTVTSPEHRFQDHSHNYLSSTVIPLHRTNFESSSGSSTVSTRGKKTLLGAIWTDKSSQSKQLLNFQFGTVSQPTPGSLASVLGMQVDVARHAPPVRTAPLQ